MVCFPLFVDLNDKTALVVGGGPVAARKARVLLDYRPPGAGVAPPALSPRLEQLSGAELLRQPFVPELLEGVSLAVAATDDRQLNHAVAQLCRERSIPVNVADSREDSTFLFPAVVRRGRLSVGISTGGASPAAAAHVRRTLERQLPESLDPILDWLENQREAGRDALPPSQRMTWFSHLLSAALEKGRPSDPRWRQRPFCINSYQEEIP